MKEEILRILDTAALTELEKQRLTDALFVLYGVSNYSELLIAELVKAKSLTEHLTIEERNEYFDLVISNL